MTYPKSSPVEVLSSADLTKLVEQRRVTNQTEIDSVTAKIDELVRVTGAILDELNTIKQRLSNVDL